MTDWGWYTFGFVSPVILFTLGVFIVTVWEWARDMRKAKRARVVVTITCTHCGRRFVSGSKRRSRAMLRDHFGIGNYWCRQAKVPTSELIPDKNAAAAQEGGAE